MSYKIAVASSDGINIDISFGAAVVFMIYEVEGDSYTLVEEREVNITDELCVVPESKCGGSCSGEIGQANGHGNGNGCGGIGNGSQKVELIADCRSVVCNKVGFNIQKQLERRAITSFGVTCTIGEALDKISAYYSRVDNHQSLRGSMRNI